MKTYIGLGLLKFFLNLYFPRDTEFISTQVCAAEWAGQSGTFSYHGLAPSYQSVSREIWSLGLKV